MPERIDGGESCPRLRCSPRQGEDSSQTNSFSRTSVEVESKGEHARVKSMSSLKDLASE